MTLRIFAQELPEYKNIPGFEKFKFADGKIGDILSALLPYVFRLAGLLLGAYLILGGFELLTSSGNPDTIQSAKSKITNALVGFLVVFISYWLVQILEVIFGLQIL